MTTNPPCLLTQDPVSKHWVAFNEDGRMIFHCQTRSYAFDRVRELGYDPISPNSYLAATIRDIVRLRSPLNKHEQ